MSYLLQMHPSIVALKLCCKNIITAEFKNCLGHQVIKFTSAKCLNILCKSHDTQWTEVTLDMQES